MRVLLEMRAFPYLWRDPNSLSLLIYSSSPIPKWLVSDHFHPYAKIVPTCYSFWLGEGVVGEIELGLGHSLKAKLLTSRHRLYASSFIH